MKLDILGALGALVRTIFTPKVAASAIGETRGRVPLWWTVAVAAAGAYAAAAFGAPLCP